MAKNKALITRGDSTMDKIRAYYTNPSDFELSDTLEVVRKRLVHAYNLKMSYFSNMQIVKLWEKDYGLSQAQAYIDIRNAQVLFGQVNKLDRDAKRNMLYEYTMSLLRRARENGDTKTEAKALDLLGKYSGLSEEDIAQFNPEKFENREISVAIPVELQKVLIEMMQHGTLDMNAFNATTIEYQEVEEQEDGEEQT